jgi:hypothetical protein
MTKKILLLIGFCSALVACSTHDTNKQNRIYYTNQAFQYSVTLPATMSDSGSWLNGITRDSGPFFGTKVNRQINPPFGMSELSLKIHHFNDVHCDSKLIGIADKNSIQHTNEKMIWGKMDFYKGWNLEGWEPPYDKNILVCDYYLGKPQSILYGFCDEKNNKTVIMCLTQLKDNPSLAEDIFKSFRWTK